jgi:hypothetical protein
MKVIMKWLPLLAALTVATIASAASPKMTCTLTGKEVKTCCCEQQKNRKLFCQAGEEGSREVLLHRDVSDENREGGGLEWQAKEKSKFSQRTARFVKTHCSW